VTVKLSCEPPPPPLNDRDLAEFVGLQKSFADSAKSWYVEVDAIDQQHWDL
jgi:type I restriction enzyme M protein